MPRGIVSRYAETDSGNSGLVEAKTTEKGFKPVAKEWNRTGDTSARNHKAGQREGACTLFYQNIKGAAPGFRALHDFSGRGGADRSYLRAASG